MRNVKAVLLLLTVSILSAATTVCFGINNIFSASFDIGDGAVLPETVPSFVNAIVSATEPSNNEGNNVNSNTKISDAAPTAAPSGALGRIISQTFSHSGVSVYGNVFIKNTSSIPIDIASEYNAGIDFKIIGDGTPEVLIVHTHATESYMQHSNDYYTDSDRSRSTDLSKNMTAVGDKVAEKISSSGVGVLHDKTLHDYPSYSGSYTRAAKTINGYLKKYPSIKIVIDIHRDAISSGKSDKVKAVTDINGKPAAQVMFVQGSDKDGTGGFKNWKNNLRVAMRIHNMAESMYPGLMRPILLTDKKYNEGLTSGSVLMEFGSDANSMDEALYSASLMGSAVAEAIKTMK